MNLRKMKNTFVVCRMTQYVLIEDYIFISIFHIPYGIYCKLFRVVFIS